MGFMDYISFCVVHIIFIANIRSSNICRCPIFHNVIHSLVGPNSVAMNQLQLCYAQLPTTYVASGLVWVVLVGLDLVGFGCVWLGLVGFDWVC